MNSKKRVDLILIWAHIIISVFSIGFIIFDYNFSYGAAGLVALGALMASFAYRKSYEMILIKVIPIVAFIFTFYALSAKQESIIFVFAIGEALLMFIALIIYSLIVLGIAYSDSKKSIEKGGTKKLY